MKEIKFRVWNTYLKKWVYINFRDLLMSLESIRGHEYDLDHNTLGQFTGLKDKNGKEIYEGDICRYYNPEDKDGICEIKEDYALWISGTIKDTSLMTALFYLKCSSEWEIIGNIHEEVVE